jgi:hypothetical protein
MLRPIFALSSAFGLVATAFAFVDSPGVSSPDGRSFSVNVHEFAIYCPPSWPVSIGFDCNQGIYAVLRGDTDTARYPNRDYGTILCFGVPGTVCPAGIRTVSGFPPNIPNPTSAVVAIELWNSAQEFWGFGGDDVTGPMTIALAPCPPGQVRNPVTGQCEGRHTIKLENPGIPATTGALAEVEPGKPVALVAQVYDENNVRVPGISVTLQSEVTAYSGGHQHDDTIRHTQHAGAVPASVASGNSFTFTAPALAGDHTITAQCADNSCGTASGSVWVGIRGLVSIPSSGFWNLIPNADAGHPANKHLTGEAFGKLTELARLYTQVYFPLNTPVLQLNDASLERGGLFDLGPNYGYTYWNPQHHEHRRGSVIDIQANGTATAIPEKNFKDFQKLLDKLKMSVNPEKLNKPGGHFHVRLNGVAE